MLSCIGSHEMLTASQRNKCQCSKLYRDQKTSGIQGQSCQQHSMPPPAVSQGTPEASSRACLRVGSNEEKKVRTQVCKRKLTKKKRHFVFLGRSLVLRIAIVRIAGLKSIDFAFLSQECWINRHADGGQSRGIDLEGSYEGCVYIPGGCHLIQQQS